MRRGRTIPNQLIASGQRPFLGAGAGERPDPRFVGGESLAGPE